MSREEEDNSLIVQLENIKRKESQNMTFIWAFFMFCE